MADSPSDAVLNGNNAAGSKKTVLPQWLIRLCISSRMIWLGPLIGMVLSLPSLFSGYMLDEHFFRQNQVADSVYRQRQPWDYFNFVSSKEDIAYYQERSILCTWWTNDGFRMRMFRPLASLYHAAQFRYLHDNTILMHAGSILLYGLMILIVFLTARRFSTTPAAQGITVLLFAINDVHAYTSGWITSSNTLFCCVAGLSAFLMHDRWRRSGHVRPLLLFTVTFISALLFSEGAIALGGYLLAYALFIENGSILKKIRSLLPFSFITICYLGCYAYMQLGTHCSGVYTAPGDLFSIAGISAAGKWLGLLFAQLVSCPILNFAILTGRSTGFIMGLLLLAVILIVIKKELFSTPVQRFYFAAAVFSIAPFALGPMQERLLLWSGMGAAGLFGEVFTAEVPVKFFKRLTIRFLAFNNIVFSLLFFIPTLYMVFVVEAPSRKIASVVTSHPTVVLNAPWDISTWYAPAIASETGKSYPEHLYMLYAGVDTITIRRTGEKSLDATVNNGWFSESEYSQYTVSPKHPFSAGDTVSLQKMKVTVLEVNAKGQPVHVLFEFTEPLERYDWIVWTAKGPQIGDAPKAGTVITQCVKVL